MGRTGRSRQKRYKHCNVNISCELTFIKLVKWLKNNEWNPTSSLQPVFYQDFGRGLMTKAHINKGDILLSLPYNVLITSDVVEESPVACVFHCIENLKAQDILSLFLTWEKLRGPESMWHSYIRSLPTNFSLPLFCSKAELALMPSFIYSTVQKQREKVLCSFKCIANVLKTLQCCHTCGRRHTSDFISMDIKYDDFLWAWSVVNTRSVFCQKKQNYSMKVTDSHCLALAPLLDMFNHSNESDLKAELTNDGHYKIIASHPISKYSQVFIHYGHHSNLHLYLEYGFVIPNNIYDNLIFGIEDVLSTTNQMFPYLYSYCNAKKTFVSSHRLYRDLMCTSEGISFNVKALIYLVTASEVEKHNFQKKIYSNCYNEVEQNIINVVGAKLVEMEILKYTEILDLFNARFEKGSESFNVARALMNAFLDMLRKAMISFENIKS